MRLITYQLILAAGLALPAYAQQADHAAAHGDAHAARAPLGAQASVEGEVRKVDKKANKITLRHGPIPSLDMPAMTMAYHVQDAALLDRIKVGDQVKFTAVKLDGHYTVTHLERAAN